MIDCDGENRANNGLAVLDTGLCLCKTRITATTYMGQSGIINIEKEAEMMEKCIIKGYMS